MTRRWAWSTCIVAGCLAAAPSAHAQQTRPDAPSASPLVDRIVPLDTTVNGTPVGVWPFVERLGQLYVGRDAFEEWRLTLPPQLQPITVRGQEYWPLHEIRDSR